MPSPTLPLASPPRLRLSRFCPHAPTPRQAVFLSLDHVREGLYGGSAGGGKSEALLMAALAYVDVPRYSALILRRSFPDLALPGAIMDRAKAWLRTQPEVRWSEATKTFTFPSGARLAFGYLEAADDVYRYQGAEFQSIGFDELTQFTEAQYTYLVSRLRRADDLDVPLRMRSASNPGGVGHEWVKARFLPQPDPRTARPVYPRDAAGRRRVFVPARLADNPHLSTEEYAQVLAGLPPVLRAQLLDGDWGAKPPGELFDATSFRLVDGPPEAIGRWVRYWDLAGSRKRAPGHDPDWTVGTLMGRTTSGGLYVADVRRVRETPGAVKALVLRTALLDRALGCRTIRIEQEPGSAGLAVIDDYARALLGFDFAGDRVTGPKAERAVPYAAAVGNGLVAVRRASWTADWLAEHEAFPQDAVHDDQVDSASGAFAYLAASGPAAGVSLAPGPAAALVNRSLAGNPYHAPRGRGIGR